MKLTYILADGSTTTLNTVVNELERYIHLNEQWKSNPSAEDDSFGAEAYGAKDIVEFIRSHSTREEIESTGSIAKLEKNNGKITATLEGDRGSLFYSRTHGVNTVLAKMFEYGYIRRKEYRTVMPFLEADELWDSKDQELVERLARFGYTPEEYLEVAKLRTQYEEAFLKHAFSVWTYGGLTDERNDLENIGLKLFNENSKELWTLADNANIVGIDSITHNGAIGNPDRSPLDLTQSEAAFIVESNKKRIMTYIRGKSDWVDEDNISEEESE